MEISSNEYMSIIGALIGAVGALVAAVSAVLVRSLSVQMKLLRDDNERLWEQVGELRGALHQTRENYVSKHDFDGAINRLIIKLDSIDMKVGQSVSRSDCRDRMRGLHDDMSGGSG